MKKNKEIKEINEHSVSDENTEKLVELGKFLAETTKGTNKSFEEVADTASKTCYDNESIKVSEVKKIVDDMGRYKAESQPIMGMGDKLAESAKQSSNDGFHNIPPFEFTRNHFGLLNHVDYIFCEDGTVNWRAMVPNEYLVPNKQNFERRKQPVPKNIEGLDDKDLLILLGGIKHLAAIRGFSKVDHEVIEANDQFVAVKTTITLIPNYETGYLSVSFSDLADASIYNTSSFAKHYLSAIAANRGFVRAWRNVLRLPILGQDEIGEAPADSDKVEDNKMQAGSPHATLQKKLDEKNIQWPKFKHFCVGKQIPNSDKWEDIQSVDKDQIVNILNLMSQKEQLKEKEVKHES